MPGYAGKMRNLRLEGNTFYGIDTPTSNPLTVSFAQNTASSKWTVPTNGMLPFSGQALQVESVVAETAITNASGVRISEMPSVTRLQGAAENAVTLNFAIAVKDTAGVRVRMDIPN